MPTYLYKSLETEEVFEVTHSMNDSSLTEYTDKDGKLHKVERVYTAPPVHFKGRGFYETDYKPK